MGHAKSIWISSFGSVRLGILPSCALGNNALSFFTFIYALSASFGFGDDLRMDLGSPYQFSESEHSRLTLVFVMYCVQYKILLNVRL